MTNLGYTPEEPICAIATVLAPGAIGIVRASGTGCIEKAAELFSRKDALKNAQANTLVYGWITDPETKQKIDQVMAGIYRAPKSFTGEDMVEIFCHGGINVVKAIHSLFLKNGFRQAERGEFTFRAYINGKTDLTKAEAVREIIDSKTNASRSRACGRLAGNLFEEIDAVKKLVVDSLAAIEVEIEYPEDEENISDTFDESKLVLAKEKLNTLASSWKSEKLYQDGAKVVLCGKTNAGKSSLFNSLLKEERAIVSDIEGTTRDWLESYADFDGIPVRLFDTAGLRKTDDVIEEKGVELTKDLSKEADLVLYLIDSLKGLSNEDKTFIEEHKKNSPVPLILVFNKCENAGTALDSSTADSDTAAGVNSSAGAASSTDEGAGAGVPCANAASSTSGSRSVYISAKTGLGISELVKCVKEALESSASSEKETAGLGSERQKECVCSALERIEHALLTARSGEYGLDAVVQDLEDSLDSLGEVTGSVTPEDVLGSVFANFCVGK